MSSTNINNEAPNQQSLTFGKYSLRVLTLDDAEPVLQLLSREFQSQQPLCNAFNRVVPVKDKQERHQEWVKFYKLYEKHYLTNGISVGAFDTTNKDELVGVSITKDFTYDNQGLQELYMKGVNFMSVSFKVQRQLRAKMGQPYRSILAQAQPGVVLECYSVAIKKEHSGKQLIHEMGKLLIPLAALKKYSYIYTFVTNFKSAMAFKSAHFRAVSTLDVKQFKIEGVRYFEKIEEENRYASLLIRPAVIKTASL